MADELGAAARDGELARLLDLGLEDDLVAGLLPHLGDEGLARQHGAGEADLDAPEGTEPLVHGLGRHAHEAQPVQDRLLEAAHLGEARVDVERAARGERKRKNSVSWKLVFWGVNWDWSEEEGKEGGETGWRRNGNG